MTLKIPLNLKVRNSSQRKIAYAQDILAVELYVFFPRAVIHGGTAIWRCYSGNRFSEDLDVYLEKDEETLKRFFSSLESKGFRSLKKRIKERSVYAEWEFNGISVRFEATFQVKKSVSRKYETSESFFINVETLAPEELLMEKVETYLKRRKIRDLYDIYFLLSHIQDTASIQKPLKKLLDHFEPPADEENLSAIVISGSIPSSKQLLEGIKRWEK